MYFDAVQYSILASTKIVIVALLTRTVLKRQLTEVQFVSFAILAAGVIINQYNFCTGDSGAGTTTATGTARNNAEGYLVVLVAEVIGGSAGILNEFLMKAAPRASIHYQNLNLYAGSVLIYAPIVLIADHARLFAAGPLGLFSGFSGLVWAMVLVNALRGLSISHVYKSATNMTKIFVISISTLFQGLLAHFFTDSALDARFFLGFWIISCALYLYAREKSDELTAGRIYSTVEDDAALFEMDGLGGIE
jgi:hypothetical protein